LAHARENGKRLGRPATVGLHTAEIRKLHRAGISKAEIARRLGVGRTSVRLARAIVFEDNTINYTGLRSVG
jgi:putative DNA-invertase from lambdoid prophage Rac